MMKSAPKYLITFVATTIALALASHAQTTEQDEVALRKMMIDAREATGQSLVRQAEDRVSQDRMSDVGARPVDAFQGCERTDAAPAQVTDPRARIEQAARSIDPISNREFVSFSLDELDSRDALPDGECWHRLDGIWRQDATVSLDTSFRPGGWGSTKPELVSLANSTYTMPSHIAVDPSADSNAYLIVRDAMGLSRPVRYDAVDQTDLADVLVRNGPRKVYNARGNTGQLGNRLVIDVTRTGYVRMQIGDVTFLRPRPGTAKADWNSQLSNTDPFMIGFTMENLAANRRGYDVVNQNPNRLLDNSRADVFARTERGYAIDERRIVPLGLRLIKEEMQGLVYYTELVSSEREFQEMLSSSFGNSTKFGVSGSASAAGAGSGGSSATGGINIEAGVGWGASSARESFEALRNSNAVAKETGFMRFRKYALVLDPAYAQLSDGFIDAVEDARRYGDYERLVEKFGTHYPYAVSYGASGRLTQTITTEAYAREVSASSNEQSNTDTSFVVGNASAYSSTQRQSGSNLRETNEYGERSFDAVGGNGSWSEAGFSAGDAHYPVLADLRPLDDLLNPMNFPDEPEIYGRVRIELAQAIAVYLSRQGELSEASLLPQIEPTQKWNLRTTMLACDSAGSEPNDELEIAGQLNIFASRNPARVSFPALRLIDIDKTAAANQKVAIRSVNCAKGRQPLVMERTIEGTANHLRELRFRVNADLLELDYAGFLDPDDEIKGKSGEYLIPIEQNRPVGHVERQSWRLPPGNEGTHMGLHWTLTRTQ